MATTQSAVAEALDYPANLENFSSCTYSGQEFCVKSLTYQASGEPEIQFLDPATNDGSNPYVEAYFQGTYSGPSTPGNAFGLMPVFIFVIKTADMYSNRNGKTFPGIDQGIYRVQIRLGDYDPTYMIMRGNVVSYEVSKGKDGNFTVDLEVSTIPWLYVGGAELTNCHQVNWLSNCEATYGIKSWIQGAIAMSAVDVTRNVARGYWIATSASEFLLSQPTQVDNGAGVKEFQQGFTVAAPHFVPDDFDVPNLSQEDGRNLYPAFFETYVPFASIKHSLSKITSLKDITVEKIKEYLSTEGRLLQGVILNQDGQQIVQDLTTTLLEEGVRINFNLAHFSSPNPTLITVSPQRDRKLLTNGASISTLRRVTKASTVTFSKLFAPSLGASISGVTSRSTSTCKVSGTSIRMIRAGTCAMTVTVKKSGKKAKAKVFVLVS